MSVESSIQTYLQAGLRFIRDHPQLWVTGLLAVLIGSSFVFISLRFAGLAGDAQEQLFNDRGGWLLDGVATFSSTMLDRKEQLRAHLARVVSYNETLVDLTILKPQGNGVWLRYVSYDGVGENESYQFDPRIQVSAANAFADPNNVYRGVYIVNGERRFVTSRAVVDTVGTPVALSVAELRLSDADRTLSEELLWSWIVLGGVLTVVLVLFFRHARIVDFATLYKKQLEIDQMKDSFLSMASHELKSPLSVIRGYIEYLKDESTDATTRKEFLRRIDISADELRQLIDDILDVSRIEMGRLRFSPDYVKPAEIIDEVVEMFKVTAEGKQLALSHATAEDDRTRAVRVDRGRLKQVIVNLVSNSMKYTMQGSVTVSQRVVDGWLEMAIKDTGVGMTADEQKKLFEKFYRVEAEETRGVRGTGLGLWITKYITEHMGGTISVESIKGEGSRFVIRFPVYVEHAPVAEKEKTT